MSADIASAAAVPPPKSNAKTWWRRNRFSVYLPSAIMIAILCLLVVPPIYVLVKSSFVEAGRNPLEYTYGFRNYLKLFTNPLLYVSAANSVIFAAGATVVALAMGATLAWIVERTNAPFGSLAYATTIISLGTPNVLYVGGWLLLLGRVGPVNELYRYMTGSTDNLINVYSIPGMILVEGMIWLPLVFLLVSATFKRSNAEMEEAARMSGASVTATVWHISLQMARPALFGLAIFVFIRNLEAFDVPLLIGTPSRISLLTSDIYQAMHLVPPDHGYASAFSTILMIVIIVLLHFYRRIARNADKYASITGKGFRPRPFDLGKARWVGGLITILCCLVALGLPLIAIIWTSLMPFAHPIGFRGLSLITFKHYTIVLSDPYYIDLAKNTLIVAATAATVAVLLTSVAAWMSVRRWPFSPIIDQLVNLPLIFPGIVLGVAVIQMALSLPFALYGSLWIISLAFLIRYLPYGMRYAHAGVMQVHRELEEAAGVAGSGNWGVFRRIVVPLISPSLVAAWLFIFLLGARELSIAVLLAGSRTQTVATAMLSKWTAGQPGEVAALGVIWTVVLSLCAALMMFFSRKQTSIGS